MRRTIESTVMAALLLLGAAKPVVVGAEPLGAEPSQEIRTEEVVVSATKTEQAAYEVSVPVQVITGEQMEERKMRTVADALRLLGHGLTVFSSGGPGALTEVRIRGAQAKHTLVLIDGAIVNSPTDGAFNFANLTAENIERIEILRGAQSMLWGADAIGGVINITTKKGRGRPTVGGFIEYGSFATLRENVQASGKKGRLDFTLSLLRWDTSSFSAVNYRRGAIERDGYHNWQASSRIGIDLPRDGRLDFNLRWWDTDFAFDDFTILGTPADSFGARQTTRTLILSTSYAQPITNWWSQRLTLARGREHIVGRNGPLGRDVATGQILPADPSCGVTVSADCFVPFRTDIEFINHRIEWQHNLQPTKWLTLTPGYQFREELGRNPDAFGVLAQRRIASHAGFLQGQVNAYDRVFLTAGGRYDQYNVFGDATTYKVTGAYVHHETGTKLRASYGTGFRTPTLNDLFFQAPFFLGNPNLRPEESESIDVGLDQSFLAGRLQLSGGYFRNHFTNLIANDLTTFPITLVNVNEARTQGAEARVEYALTPTVTLWGQYTYTDARDTRTNRLLPLWPHHLANGGVAYRPLPSVAIYLDYRYVGARFRDPGNQQALDSFNVVRVAAHYDVSKRVQIFGRFENVLDEQYEEIPPFGTPIRSVFGGVRFTL